MNQIRIARTASVAISIWMLSGTASADAGVPMLFVTLPAMVVALIPIIALEAFVVGRVLGTRILPRIKSVAVANVASTIIGLPVTWVALVILELITGGGSAYGMDTPARKLLAVTWQAPWLIPYENEMYWMLPAASLTLLVPFFFASYFVEILIVRRIERTFSAQLLKTTIYRANLASYMVLATFTMGWLLFAIHRGPHSS